MKRLIFVAMVCAMMVILRPLTSVPFDIVAIVVAYLLTLSVVLYLIDKWIMP